MIYNKIVSRNELDFVTLSEAKRQLNITESHDDLHIANLIKTAMELCEKETRRALSPVTVKMVIKGVTTCYLPYGEVATVDTVVDADGNTLEFMFNDVTQLFTLLTPTTGEVTVTYNAGYAQGKVPQAAKMAALMLISTLYEFREDEIEGATIAQMPFGSIQLLGSIKLGIV